MGKAKNALMKAKNAALGAVRKKGIGKTGHEKLEYGTSGVLMVASKNMDQLPLIPVKPDVAGVIAGAGLMLLGGKRGKLGKTVFKGALHACLARAVYSPDGMTLIQGVNGPVAVPTAGAKKASNVKFETHIHAGKVAGGDDDEDDDDDDDDGEEAKKAA